MAGRVGVATGWGGRGGRGREVATGWTAVATGWLGWGDRGYRAGRGWMRVPRGWLGVAAGATLGCSLSPSDPVAPRQ